MPPETSTRRLEFILGLTALAAGMLVYVNISWVIFFPAALVAGALAAL